MQKVASDSKQKEFIKYIALFQKITPALFKFLVGPQIEEAEGEGCKIFQSKVLQILTEEAAFCKCYVHSILCLLVISLFFSHDSYLPILKMIGMPEIDILDVAMCDTMLALVC